MKWGENDPGKISAKSDNWFKSYGQKVEKRHFLGTGYPGQITRFPGTRILPITRFLLPGSWQAYRVSGTGNGYLKIAWLLIVINYKKHKSTLHTLSLSSGAYFLHKIKLQISFVSVV